MPSVALGCSAAEMDVAAGGAGASVTMGWYQQGATSHTITGFKSEVFSSTDPIDKQTRFWTDNTSSFTLGQFILLITPGSDTNKTANALPATFYVMVFLDGKVRKPSDAGFNAEEGWLVPHA